MLFVFLTKVVFLCVRFRTSKQCDMLLAQGVVIHRAASFRNRCIIFLANPENISFEQNLFFRLMKT